jgi:alpha-1,3-glucosyltransferase
MPTTNSLRRICLFLQLFCFVPLILVDHIHFQYNGILMGILLFCVVFTCRKQKIQLTQTFSTLVLMKHLFVPMAPLFGCVLLRISLDEEKSVFLGCLSLLPSVLIAVANLIFAFGPFVVFGGISELTQIFSRLFPFGRGLVHAYWAPNLWAFYIFLDKMLLFLCRRLKLPFSADLSNALSSSSGKVGVYGLAFFPQISAGHCLFMTLIAVLVASWWLFIRKFSMKNVCRSLVFVSLSSFMFGYHVHEKAILIPLLIQTLLVHDSEEDQFLFLSLTMSGIISLFPLIPGQMELLIKGTFRRFRFFFSHSSLEGSLLVSFMAPNLLFLTLWKNLTVSRVLITIILLLSVVSLYCEIFHNLLLPSYPFLSLMILSLSCFVVNGFCWLLAGYLLLKRYDS